MPSESLVKVRMRTLSCGPFGVRKIGEVVELPASEAKALLEGGYATPEKSTAVERAVQQPAQETGATTPPDQTRPGRSRSGRATTPPA